LGARIEKHLKLNLCGRMANLIYADGFCWRGQFGPIFLAIYDASNLKKHLCQASWREMMFDGCGLMEIRISGVEN
jgi:hypothetical protein